MSGFGQARDVLQGAARFHQRLADMYGTMAQTHQHPRTVLLLNYLSNHETLLHHQVSEYEAKASQRVLDTWFQAVHPQCSIAVLDGLEPPQDLGLDELMEFALEMDSCLMESYNRLVNSSEPPAIREIFESLLELEQNQKQQLAHSAQQICDL